MKWVNVSDENGNTFHGLTETPNADTAQVWVFADKESGFGYTPGAVVLASLKKLRAGVFGA